MAATKQAAPVKRSLEERLQIAEDQLEIQRTIHQYAHSLDYGQMEEEFLDCFTEDAVCEPKPRLSFIKPTVGRADGRAGLIQFYRQHAHAVSSTSPQRYFKHFTGDPRIILDGDTATVATYYLSPTETTNEDGTHGFEVRGMGCYRDKFVRCPDGRWRIKERMIEIEAGQEKRKA